MSTTLAGAQDRMDSPRPEAASLEEGTVHVGKTPETAVSLSTATLQGAPKTRGMCLPKLRKGTKVSAVAEEAMPAARSYSSVVLKV